MWVVMQVYGQVNMCMRSGWIQMEMGGYLCFLFLVMCEVRLGIDKACKSPVPEGAVVSLAILMLVCPDLHSGDDQVAHPTLFAQYSLYGPPALRDALSMFLL